MKFILLKLEYEHRLISVPAYVADDADAYQQQFFDWLYDRNNDHGYWTVTDFGEPGVRYNGDTAFVKWLNEYVLFDCAEKAEIVPYLRF